MGSFVSKPKAPVRRNTTPRAPKKTMTKNEFMNKVITYLREKRELNKHETYILACFTSESNNKNYTAYKLEALLEIIIGMEAGK